MKKALAGALLLAILAGCDKQPEPADVPATSSPVEPVSLSGADLFTVACQACHSIAPDAPHRVGPNLYGIIDQPAASQAGFSYSEALQQSGLAWNKANLMAWVVAPESLVPGTWMLYHNVLAGDELTRLIGYIEQAASPNQP
jgi:cytochrome c